MFRIFFQCTFVFGMIWISIMLKVWYQQFFFCLWSNIWNTLNNNLCTETCTGFNHYGISANRFPLIWSCWRATEPCRDVMPSPLWLCIKYEENVLTLLCTSIATAFHGLVDWLRLVERCCEEKLILRSYVLKLLQPDQYLHDCNNCKTHRGSVTL